MSGREPEALGQAQGAVVSPDGGGQHGAEPVEGLADRLAGRCLGAVVGVARGSTLEISCWGERVPGEAITPGAVFDLASVTKLITTLAAGRAIGSGRLRLDSRVGELWPEPVAAPLAEVSVEQLLRHRSGLAPWLPLYLLSSDPDGALRQILTSPLVSTPGETFAYSDLGMILLGGLLARLEGVTVAELLTRTAAMVANEPVLGAGGADPARAVASDHGDLIEQRMVRTREPHPVPAGLAVSGFGWREHLLVGETDDGNAYHAFGGVAGHAGGFASVPGMLQLGRGVLGALTTHEPDPAAVGVRALLAAEPVDGQGLGFRVRDLEVGGGLTPVYWHPGFTGTALAVLPERDLVVAMGASRLLVAEPEPTTALFDDVLGRIG